MTLAESYRELAEVVIAGFAKQRLTLATAESLTGGLLAGALTEIPGASEVYRGGVVSYATDLKQHLLGVDQALLAQHGPVHPEVAESMARGVRHLLSADIGVATTGVAGPATQGAPVGTVWVAVMGPGHDARVRDAHTSGSREQIRAHTVTTALTDLVQVLHINCGISGEASEK
ncbi:MAG: CinA family protein [Actinomycetota bacterium]